MCSWVVSKVVKIQDQCLVVSRDLSDLALSAGEKHVLHFVQNLQIPKSVARNFDRYGICMKYQRRWYKICVRGLWVKLSKLKINVRLSAEICLHQRLSVGEKHVLHFVQNLLIPKSVARHFNRYGICMTHQRQWYKICACWLCVKLLKLKINYPLYTALLSDWRVSDSSPLAYLRERTCELDIGAFLHCKEFEDFLRALGLWQGWAKFSIKEPRARKCRTTREPQILFGVLIQKQQSKFYNEQNKCYSKQFNRNTFNRSTSFPFY